MPKYIIHIGPPKTGSTYLQSTLFHARDTLRASGIIYPDNWWTHPDQITHAPLFRLLRDKRFGEVKEAFQRINSTDCRIVVLSCEAFEDLTPEQFEALRDSIGKHPIDIVYYCRRWCERIPSAWKQTIKTGSYSTFPEFYMASVRHPKYSGFFNTSLIWATIARHFGRKNLKLVSYNSLREKNIDLFRHFAETFLDWRGEANVRKDLILPNHSPNTFDTEILRALNWIDYDAVGRTRPNMHVKLNVMRSAIDTRGLEELMAGDIGTVELSDGAEAFRVAWKEMNKYADCLVPKTFFRKRPFELRTASIPYVRGNYLLKEYAVRELRSLYKRLDETPCDAPDLI